MPLIIPNKKRKKKRTKILTKTATDVMERRIYTNPKKQAFHIFTTQSRSIS